MRDYDDNDYDPAWWQDAEIFAYVRKSLVLGEEDRISIVKQKDAIVGELTHLGFPEPARWFADADKHRSGRHERTRPDWMRMKTLALQSQKALIIVCELDRSNRNVLATAELIETLRKAPKRYRIIFIYNRFDSAVHGWGAREIKNLHDDANDAQHESDKAAERMGRTIKTLKSHDVPWGTTPYGLVRMGKGMKARWELGKHAAAVVRLLTTWAKPGQSYESTARALNNAGLYYYKAQRDTAGNRYELPQQWHSDRVRQIVCNVLTYSGYLMPRGGRAKKRLVKLVGDGTLLERYAAAYKAKQVVTIAPLVDAATAEKVVAKRLGRQSTGRTPGAEWYPWLSGLLFYKGKQLRGQCNKHCHYYRTRGRASVSWNADALEAEIMENLRGLAFPAVALAKIRGLVAERTGGRDQLDASATIIKMDEALLNLERKSALGDFEGNRVGYIQLKDEFEAKRRAAQTKAKSFSHVDAVLASLLDIGATIDRLTPAQRNLALDALFERIELDDRGIKTITPREWSRAAFGSLVWAWRQLYPALGVPIVTPTGVASEVGTPAKIEWWFSRIPFAA